MQVKHGKEARLAEALEQAANNAEQVTCLTAQLKELEFDKVVFALIDISCVMQLLARSIGDSLRKVECLTSALQKQLSSQKEQMLKEHSEEREASQKQLRQHYDSQMSVLNERLAHQNVRHCPEHVLKATMHRNR